MEVDVIPFFEFASLHSRFGSNLEDIQELPLSPTWSCDGHEFSANSKKRRKYDDIESLIGKMVELFSTTQPIVNDQASNYESTECPESPIEIVWHSSWRITAAW